MNRTIIVAAFVLVGAMLPMRAGVVRGAAEQDVYPFYGCTGPAGTPTSFTARKQRPSEGSQGGAAVAYRLTDGSGVFVVLQFGDQTVGQRIPAGRLTTTCQIDFAQPVGTMAFTGFIAPGEGR